MSQDSKGGRTMIGTVAPIVPRSTHPTGAPPVGPGSGQHPTLPGGPQHATNPGGAPPANPSAQYPTSPPGQFAGNPAGNPAPYPTSPPGQFAGNPTPYPTSPSGELAGNPGQFPPGQYPTNPPGQYPANPPGQYPANPPGQYPTNPPGQYPTNPPGQYPTNPPGQFGGSPSGHYPAGGQFGGSLGPQQPTIAASPGAQAAHLMPTRVPASTGPVPLQTAGLMTASDEAEMFIGQELSGYLIRRKLAEGGMGVVYEGEHTKIGRRGAIKVLKLEFCRNKEVVDRFLQEARSVNSIRHENIVDIYDIGKDANGRAYFVMEYLEGEPLSGRIRRGPLAWREAFTILEQTLRALRAAHDKGFVHRDLKPDNIWLKRVEDQIQVKLLDFGIAKLVGTDSPQEKLTRTGSVIGTPHYMSPEQINGSASVDHRTDIYAMGVIMYEMFAGRTPFGGDTLQAIMTGHLFQEPPRLAELPPNLGVPPPIAEIVDRMLVKDAAQRYASVAEVLSDLHDVYRNELPTHAGMRRTQPPPTAPRKRSKAPLLIVAGLAIAAIAGVAIWASQQKQLVAIVPTRPVEVPTPTPTPTPPPPPVINPEQAGKDARVVLQDGVRHTEPPVRVQSTDEVGRIRDTKSAELLKQRLPLDEDPEVRGHLGNALGALGAADTAPLLTKLEKEAPPPLKVWYASGLARLGDREAFKRLLGYARDKDLAVSLKAALTLGDIGKPGDKAVIAALKPIGGQLMQAGAQDAKALLDSVKILTKLAALRDKPSRDALHGLLANNNEGIRLGAAEGLAKLGDDAGKKVLQDVLANTASPSQLDAAVAQIALGEYGGLDLINAKLADKDPSSRRLAARGLGDMADDKSLKALIALTTDKDWTVRIAAAGAIISIVGLDQKVLAQASVDWTKSALDSESSAVRKQAAAVLADIPDQTAAVALLAHAFDDKDAGVRAQAANSAKRMKSAEAAKQVVAAVTKETDPVVKIAQVKALGEIGEVGKQEAREMLAQISQEPGSLGVFAAGSLVAVGDTSGAVKLEAAVAAPQTELRLAAVEAASAARNPIVVPTLKIGVRDKIFGVRFAAAEGLSLYMDEKAEAAKVLTEALTTTKDADILGRAMAALTRFGEKISASAQTPGELLDSPDPKRRLAAVPVVRALPVGEGVPLLRRLVNDVDLEVRRAGVDAIEDVIAKDRDQAIKLYKPLVNDDDPGIRARASGQLSRLVVTPKVEPPPPPPPPKDPTPMPPAPPSVQPAFDDAKKAADDAGQAAKDVEKLAADLTKATTTRAHDNATIGRATELKKQLEAAQTELDKKATAVETAVATLEGQAGATPPPDAAKLVEGARAFTPAARQTASVAREKATDAIKALGEYADPQPEITRAIAAIVGRNFPRAQQNLDMATALVRLSGVPSPSIDDARGELYDGMADDAADAATKRKLLRQAEDAYRRFVKAGAGPRVQRANGRLKDIAEELKSLGQ